MGFAEALSDDGALTGRGSPWLRGTICGLMTTIGGIGHTLPYLVPDSWHNAFWIATAMPSASLARGSRPTTPRIVRKKFPTNWLMRESLW
jgi:hypothetical protein